MFDACDALWSYVGNKALMSTMASNPTMNFGQLSGNKADEGVILYKFGHVLGLGHEHQSLICGGLITLKADSEPNTSWIQSVAVKSRGVIYWH
jgi:hypothetical protein